MYKLRDYQQKASDAAIAFFNDSYKSNGIIVIPTGGGKSLIIADIASRLEGRLIVFQPNKEILEQNYAKLLSYGVAASVYSASLGKREVGKITFATIGSVKNCPELFIGTNHIIVDECHLVNPKEGMYRNFFSEIRCKVLGFTATPYRLYSSQFWGSQLKFITRLRPAVFHRVVYHVQVSTLQDMGYLAKMKYYKQRPFNFSRKNLIVNSTGADYTDKSVQDEYRRVNFSEHLSQIINRLLNNRVTGSQRRGILVFTRFLKEAKELQWNFPGIVEIVSGETSASERADVLRRFKSGEVKVVANVGVLTTGFDYPELDTIVMARPTMSLSLWYQIVGRAIRPHPSKQEAWVIDLCGNYERFGAVKDLKLEQSDNGKWAVTSGGRQLTNVNLY